jgi:hypothetical protein
MFLKNRKLVKPTYNNEIEVYINGDYNDADYSNETTEISIEEFEKLEPLFLKLKESIGGYNWKNREDIFTDEEIELLEDFIPYGEEDCDIHSIDEISCYFLSKEDSIKYEIEL